MFVQSLVLQLKSDVSAVCSTLRNKRISEGLYMRFYQNSAFFVVAASVVIVKALYISYEDLLHVLCFVLYCCFLLGGRYNRLTDSKSSSS